MKATLLLADYAVVQDGKLNLIGAGWTVTAGGQHAIPFGMGIIFEIPWDLSNTPHHFNLKLVDEDGNPVMLQSAPDSTGEPMAIPGKVEVGRPAGVPPGTTLQSVLALNVSPVPLPPGKAYTWRLELAGQPDALAVQSFRTRDAQ